MKNVKLTIDSEKIFSLAYGILLAYSILVNTMFHIGNTIGWLCRIAMVILVAVKIIGFDKLTVKRTMLYALIGLVLALVIYKTSYNSLLDIYILIIGANGISFNKIVRAYFNVACIVLIVTFLSSQLGIIEDLVFIRNNGMVRHAFGYGYPTDFAALIFFIIIADIYFTRGRKVSIIRLVIYTSLAVFTKVFCDTRLDSLSMILAILGYIYIHIRKGSIINAVEKILFYSIIPVAAAMVILMSYRYNSSNPLHSALNTLLSGRLALGFQAIQSYGFSLFGKHIVMHGLGGSSTFRYDEYFYIDSSYLNIALRYGLLVLVLLCLGYIYLMHINCRKNNIAFGVVVLIIAVNSIVAQHLFEVAYNPFILAFFANMGNRQETGGRQVTV